MSTTARRCLFCSEPLAGGRSKEHAIPGWVLRELDADQFTAVQYENTQTGGWSDRSMGAMALVEGRVCKACNTGWMAQLEDAARLVLPRVWNTPDGPGTLAPDEAATVARWAAKTAYMLSSASPYGHVVPQQHRASLMPPDARPATGVVVCAADHTPRDPIPIPTEVGSRNEQTWRLAQRTPPSKEARLDVAQNASYKVTLRLRRLFLTVAYWPDPEWRIERWREVHRHLCPATPTVARDLGPLGQGFSHEVIIDVHRNLGLRRR